MIRVIAVYTMRFAILSLTVLTAIIPSICASRWTLPLVTELVPTSHFPKRIPVATPRPKLLAREDVWDVFQQRGTCGFLDGNISLPVTCPSSSYVCATNTYLGNHGCCDPYQPAESCTLPTSCVASTNINVACDEECKANDFITKCSLDNTPYCVTLSYIYSPGGRTTTMKEYSCAKSMTDTIIPLIPRGYTVEGSLFRANATKTVTSLVTSLVTVITKADGQPPNTKSIVIGSVVGGVSAAGVVGFALLFILRRIKTKKHQDNELTKSDSENVSNLRLELPDTTCEELEAKAFHTQIGGHEILEAPSDLGRVELDAVPEIGGSEVFQAPSAVPGRQDVRDVE